MKKNKLTDDYKVPPHNKEKEENIESQNVYGHWINN